MYHKKVWYAGASVAVHKSHSPLMGRLANRKGFGAKSRAAVKAYNDKISKRNLTMLLNENFLPGDGHVVLGYRRDAVRPDGEGAKRDWKALCRNVRAEAARQGVPFRYVHAIGVGERGAVHHHVIVNREVLGLMAHFWTLGSMHTTSLYTKRNYQKLAKYFCGQEKGEDEDDPRAIHILGNKYSASRNLVRVEAEPQVVEAEQWRKYPAPDAGYIIDHESIALGENPVSGKPYQFYIMLPLEVPGGMAGLMRERWVERELAKNAALVKWECDRQYLALEERARCLGRAWLA